MEEWPSTLHRFPEHTSIMGRILLGYGELEFWFGNLVWIVLGDGAQAFRLMFRIWSESQRLSVADTLLRPAMRRDKLEGVYDEALAAMRYCLKIRNQYAHSTFKGFGPMLKLTNLDDFSERLMRRKLCSGRSPFRHFGTRSRISRTRKT